MLWLVLRDESKLLSFDAVMKFEPIAFGSALPVYCLAMRKSEYSPDDVPRRYLIHYSLVPAGTCKRKDANTFTSDARQQVYSATNVAQRVTCSVCLRWIQRHSP
jgi:hypothetical protein